MTNRANDRVVLTELFGAAIRAADPTEALRPHLPEKPKGRTIVVGAGKGAAQLAAAFETLWQQPVEGTVVTRYGYATVDCRGVRVLEAAHPVPDAAGLAATDALFGAVQGLTADDLVVGLFCGGGSALLPAPPKGFALRDEQLLNRALLASGAPITVMNAIRKQFSWIKGGRLAAAAHPARIVTLIVSDVPGDDPAQVASGPTVPDASDRAAALRLIGTYALNLPAPVLNYLKTASEDAPDPASTPFARDKTTVVASAAHSLDAAAKRAEELGLRAAVLSDAVEGEAAEVGKVLAAIAREVCAKNRPFERPVVLLSGGETTVTLTNAAGRGGAQHRVPAFMRHRDGRDRQCQPACGGYRWHRWVRGQCRCLCRRGYCATVARAGAGPRRTAGSQ